MSQYTTMLEQYMAMPGHEERVSPWPCFEGPYQQQPDLYYLYQDAWAARQVFEAKPTRVVDIGSTKLLVAILAQFCPVITLDIRYWQVHVPGLTMTYGDITKLPFSDNSVRFLTTMCVIEHVGLGRYGDLLDPFGSVHAFREVKRIMAPGGHFVFSVPVSHTAGLQFNAHRIFSHQQVLDYLDGFDVMAEQLLFPEIGDWDRVGWLGEWQYAIWCIHAVRQD